MKRELNDGTLPFASNIIVLQIVDFSAFSKIIIMNMSLECYFSQRGVKDLPDEYVKYYIFIRII